jgi:hypothetical protein
MNRFVIFLIVASSAFTLVPSSFSDVPALQDPLQAEPAATPPLQWVNSSTAQINNNVPITAAAPAYTPAARYQNQQAQIDMQQQQYVPNVQLPYPLETGSPSP